MADPKQRAEVLAKLAKFQKSSAAPPSRPPQPPAQQPVNTKPALPIPGPPTKGSSGGLNLVEIQRRIAEAKLKISINPAAAAALRSNVTERNNDTKPPALPVDESGNIDFKAMMDSGIIPRRETTNSKAMQRTKQQKTAPVAAAATEKKPLKLGCSSC
ncbi:unnamed protein product [Mucor hiemalis]